MKKLVWVGVVVAILLVFVGVAGLIVGGGDYARALRYVKRHPQVRAVFRAEKNPLAVAGIYAGIWGERIWLWRDGIPRSYKVAEEVDAMYAVGCDIPDYDEAKLKTTVVGTLEEYGKLVRRGDFVVLIMSKSGEGEVVKVMGTDFWFFIDDSNLKAQCYETN